MTPRLSERLTGQVSALPDARAKSLRNKGYSPSAQALHLPS
jgi:hypothetical protein